MIPLAVQKDQHLADCRISWQGRARANILQYL